MQALSIPVNGRGFFVLLQHNHYLYGSGNNLKKPYINRHSLKTIIMKKVLALVCMIGCFLFAYADIPDPPDQTQISIDLQDTCIYTVPVLELDFFVYDVNTAEIQLWLLEDYTQPYPVIKKIGDPLQPRKTNEIGLLISINRLC